MNRDCGITKQNKGFIDAEICIQGRLQGCVTEGHELVLSCAVIALKFFFFSLNIYFTTGAMDEIPVRALAPDRARHYLCLGPY